MQIDKDIVALVTGAGSGIGRALAEAIAGRGATVVCADRLHAVADETAQAIRNAGGRADAVALDVADVQSWDAACDEILSTHPSVQLICNNAGVTCARSPIGGTDVDDWDRLIAVNLSGVFYGSRFFLTRLVGNGPGHIVNTSSMCGVITCGGSGAYIASKFGVLGLSESLYFDLERSAVSVSVLCPGFVRTGLAGSADDGGARTNHEAIEAGMDPAQLAEQVVQGVEVGRFYLFTHPEYAEVVRNRNRALELAIVEAGTTRVDGRSDDVNVLAPGWNLGVSNV